MQSERAIRVALSVLAAASGVVFTTLVGGWFAIYVTPVGYPSWLVPAMWGSGGIAAAAFGWLMVHVFRDCRAAEAAAAEEATVAEAKMRGVPDAQILSWRKMREFLDAMARMLEVVYKDSTNRYGRKLVEKTKEMVVGGVNRPPLLFDTFDTGPASQDDGRYGAFVLRVAGEFLKPWDVKPGLSPEYWSLNIVTLEAFSASGTMP